MNEVLSFLQEQGIVLRVEGEHLRVLPPSDMAKEQLSLAVSLVRANKVELLACLASPLPEVGNSYTHGHHEHGGDALKQSAGADPLPEGQALCCRCGRSPAEHHSPSGYGYCTGCYRCRNGHVPQWVQNAYGFWVCACVLKTERIATRAATSGVVARGEIWQKILEDQGHSSGDFWTALEAKLTAKGYYEEVAASDERILNRVQTPRSYPAPFPAYGRRADGTFGQVGTHGRNPGEYWTLEALQQVSA